MRSSWDEVEKLFINQWRQKSTLLHVVFIGKSVPVSFNVAAVVGEAAPEVMGVNFIVLRGDRFECFVASDTVSEVEYSEPDSRPFSTAREKYACFIKFVSADGSSLIIGELLVDIGNTPR